MAEVLEKLTEAEVIDLKASILARVDANEGRYTADIVRDMTRLPAAVANDITAYVNRRHDQSNMPFANKETLLSLLDLMQARIDDRKARRSSLSLPYNS